jgi:hypothetical protein
MNIFIDKSNSKIYKGLIEKFVNGYNSKDILQGKNINDRVLCSITHIGAANYRNNLLIISDGDAKSVSTGCINATTLLEPPQQAVLFGSLANAMKVVYMDKKEKISGGNASLFTEENLSDVSEYQKELMRAYLPIFEKQLELVNKRAQFLINVIDQTSCKVYKPRQHAIRQDAMNANAVPQANPALFGSDGKLIDLDAKNPNGLMEQKIPPAQKAEGT